MAPNQHSARTKASRGSLSDRQWHDLRQAARLARSESVSITWRRDGSILITPAPQVSNIAGNRQRGQRMEQKATHDSQQKEQPMATDGPPSKRELKKQQHDAGRLQKWLAKQPAMSQSTARWQLLSQRLLWTARKATCNAVWTAWMRLQSARQKIRRAVWREWTRPHIDPPAHIGPTGSRLRARCQGLLVLGQQSLRDAYILKRARAFTRHCSGGSRSVSGWLRQHTDAMVDSTASPGAGTPVPKVRNRMSRGGRGGRSSGY